MTTKLTLYNGALLVCEERPLSSVTEATEPRRLLDAVWDGGAVDYALEQGLWNFAMRAAQLDYESSLEPAFGFQYGFSLPDDWVQPAAVCSDEYFNEPLTRYVPEGEYLFADVPTIYVRYVSNDAAYGADFSRWPQTFVEYFQHYLASKIVGKLTSNRALKDALTTPIRRANLVQQKLTDAKSKDALAQPTQFLPEGSWSRSRRLGISGDRGRRDRLIG